MQLNMRNKSFIALLLITIILIEFGCTKDELTKPVKVNFLVDLNSGKQFQSYISFYNGAISLSRIIFEGKRTEGKDINFETKPGLSFGPFQFDTVGSGSLITHFDIPQGVYSFIKLDVKLSEFEMDDPDFEAETTGLVIDGIYTSIDGERIPVFIVVSSIEGLEIQATNAIGSGSITFADEKTYNATLHFDMNYVFSSIARESFETAERKDDEGSFIEISSDSNEDLYQLILYRIQKSAKIVIE